MRSKFEKRFAKNLEDRGIEYEYEGTSLGYLKPITRGYCKACGAKKAVQRCIYTPDFYLPVQNFYIETKGRFTGADRKKHLAVREENPDLDIRFVFMSNNKLSKYTETRYGDWCEQHGFQWSIKVLPEEWT